MTPEQRADVLLSELDAIAREADSYDYGLPIGLDEYGHRLRAVLVGALADPAPVDSAAPVRPESPPAEQVSIVGALDEARDRAMRAGIVPGRSSAGVGYSTSTVPASDRPLVGLGWTRTPPSVPGRYWMRSALQGADCVLVQRGAEGLMYASVLNQRLRSVGGAVCEWYGPVEPPV